MGFQKKQTKIRKQLTAVDWLFMQLYENFAMVGDGGKMQAILDRAMKIEKQQIVNAYKAGEEKEPHSIISRIKREAEAYYNEKYGD